MVTLPEGFDWKQPDYAAVLHERIRRLKVIRERPAVVPALHTFYRDNIPQFIVDWGMTFDPRNVDVGRPTLFPFILFPRQVEWIEWFIERWHAHEYGITEKTREMGMSWLAVGAAASICMFNKGVVAGFGSRKAEYVDKVGQPKSLFEKARIFIENVPPEFNGGWQRKRDSSEMKILFPGTGSLMAGESGDGIGRGDRASFYIVDEAAFLERPQLTDASLSQTTNCRQDISTPNGMGNTFAQKRFGGKIKIFTFHWREDPRKDDAWYAKQQLEIDDPVVIAQEIDINYAASVEGVIIPSQWIQAAIGAHLKLGIQPTGYRRSGFDVADEGRDKCAWAGRHGFLLEHLAEWSGKNGDIFHSVERVISTCEEHGYENFHYDADGLGSGVRGDSRVINEQRYAAGKFPVNDYPFQGSGAVWDPEGEMVKERPNKDFFVNLKAQSWWALRLRFQATYRAVVEGLAYNPDEIISIDPKLPHLTQLMMELAQPTYDKNGVGKILVEKQPEGTRSPNLADAVMIAYHPGHSIDVWSRL